MWEQERPTVSVTVAKQFYKHAMRTVAFALAAFSIVGGLATAVLWSQPDNLDPAFAVITFMSWGGIGAAVVLAIRKPPF